LIVIATYRALQKWRAFLLLISNGHADLKINLTYLRGLEVKQLDVEDLPNLNKKHNDAINEETL